MKGKNLDGLWGDELLIEADRKDAPNDYRRYAILKWASRSMRKRGFIYDAVNLETTQEDIYSEMAEEWKW